MPVNFSNPQEVTEINEQHTARFSSCLFISIHIPVSLFLLFLLSFGLFLHLFSFLNELLNSPYVNTNPPSKPSPNPYFPYSGSQLAQLQSQIEIRDISPSYASEHFNW